MKTRIYLFMLCAGLLPMSARADVKPHALCSEGMVLQQKAKVKIWGTADKGEKVAVTFEDNRSVTQADAKGRWSVDITTGKAGGPFEMTIAGNNTITYKD